MLLSSTGYLISSIVIEKLHYIIEEIFNINMAVQD